MRAFTLIELLVTILLIAIVYTVVIGRLPQDFTKNPQENIQDIKSLSSYISKNLTHQSGVILIYGSNCNKIIFKNEKEKFLEKASVALNKSFNVYVINRFNKLVQKVYKTIDIDGKYERVCFKLTVSDGKFIEKIALKYKERYYLFLPFYQEIKVVKDMRFAKKALFHTPLYPIDKDRYHNE